MSKTNDRNIKERQSEVSTIRGTVEEILQTIDCAETCETGKDFDESLNETISLLKMAIKDLKAVRDMELS